MVGNSAGSAVRGRECADKRSLPLSLLRGLLFGAAFAALLLAAISAIAVLYDIPDAVMNYFVIAISVISVFIAGFISSGSFGKNGLLIGTMAGLIYSLVVHIAGLALLQNMDLRPELIAGIAAQCALGALGGVIGINRASGKRRRGKIR